eukprot:gnl/MRDRNA2_/MRDRNA2_114009_c0_seq1.p1 gnl/MRDRNA2_/MRDRNA2_114009_c0~~gnl/MRDRNA2_/MRDRNA2_114009_c0_seq1.p1  ORF type:complete len:598 (-),score=161.62 gnl/MRDRNA2_/MRDRNA2_114009_c0_seq1:48-1841(-)
MSKKTKEQQELEAAMDPWAPKEREVMLVEIENRLRDMILKILKPSLEKASIIAGELDDLKTMVFKHDDALNEVEVLKCQVAKQDELTKLFEGEVERMNIFNRNLEEKATAEQAAVRAELREMRSNIDNKSATITHVVREAERLWEEAQRLQKQHDEHKKASDERLDQQRSAMSTQKEEIMDVIFEIQTAHNKLLEDVWSDEHGFNHYKDEMRKVHQTLDQLPTIQATLKKHDQNIVDLKGGMQKCEKFCADTKKEINELREMFEENVSQLKGDFRELSSTLSAHHAALAKGIRESYKEELKHAASLRSDVSRFMTETDKRCADIEAQMGSADKHIQNLHKELIKDIDEVNRKRRRDRMNIDNSIKDSVKFVNGFKDQFDNFYKGMEHIAGVLNIMLEGERVDNALSIQDYVDRKQASHLVCKGDLDHPLKPEHGIQGMKNVCHQPIHEEDDRTVDARRGFKKASYLPGTVSYGEAMYERHDLLLIRDTLLVKAMEALRNGPELHEAPPKRTLKAAESPDSPLLKSKDADVKSSRSKREKGGSFHGSGQRPGSVGQPHAGGSRGHGRGSLNDSDHVKLPLISDNGTVTSLQPKALTAR